VSTPTPFTLAALASRKPRVTDTAQWRIRELEADLSRTSEDAARMAMALRAMVAECSLLRARVAELEDRQREIDSGCTRPTAPRTLVTRRLT
jgi:BMFP domain-containing protein YqiC